MRYKRSNTKQLFIIVLLVGVFGITVGFAAFSSVLNIESNALVEPDPNSFRVVFSASKDELIYDVVPVYSDGILNAETAKIDNSNDSTISNLSATFTEPGQKVEYHFFARNIGEYDAYLKNIIFLNATSGNNHKICTSVVGTSAELTEQACNDINLKIKVGTEEFTSKGITNIFNHTLLKKRMEEVVVVIEYASDGARADGDFSVEFGNITLNYSSVD